MGPMPNILEVIRDLKVLQTKESAGTATAADKARIKELQGYMSGQKKPDPAPAAPPMRPPAGTPKVSPPPVAKPAPVASPIVPRAAVAPAAAKPKSGEPDGGAFALSLDDDLMNALGEVDLGEDVAPVNSSTNAAEDLDLSNPFAIKLDDVELEEDPDESDAARTTFEVDEEPSMAGVRSGDNPFALEVPDDLEQIDLPEDNQGGVTHELADDEVDDLAVDGDAFKVKMKDDFARTLEKSDGRGSAAPAAQGPKGSPLVPDAHYEKIVATDASVVVQTRDGRLAKGVAGAFAPQAPSFTLNQLVPGKPPVAIKLEDCLTVRFVRGYNANASAAAPFPPKPAPGAGERVSVKLLDGETLVGNALPHKDGEPFILVPAVTTGNVRRIWISAKAVRTVTKLP